MKYYKQILFFHPGLPIIYNVEEGEISSGHNSPADTEVDNCTQTMDTGVTFTITCQLTEEPDCPYRQSGRPVCQTKVCDRNANM